MVLAPNPGYSGGSYSSMRLILISYANAKKTVREMTQLLIKHKRMGIRKHIKTNGHKAQTEAKYTKKNM